MVTSCKVTNLRFNFDNSTIEWDPCKEADEYVVMGSQGVIERTTGTSIHVHLQGNREKKLEFFVKAKTSECGAGEVASLEVERTFVPGTLDCP